MKADSNNACKNRPTLLSKLFTYTKEYIMITIIIKIAYIHKRVYCDYYNFRHPALCIGTTSRHVQTEVRHVCTNTQSQLTRMIVRMQK